MKTRHVRRLSTAALTLALLATFGSPVLPQQAPRTIAEYSAIASNPATSESARVVIRVFAWTSAEQDAALETTLAEGGSEALWELLSKSDDIGRIRITGEMEEPFRYAVEHDLEDGTRTIVFASDRPVGFEELVEATRSRRFNISLVVLNVNAKGEGNGVILLGADIKNDEQGNFTIEAYGAQPIQLRSVREKRAG